MEPRNVQGVQITDSEAQSTEETPFVGQYKRY